jgi:hypothetical protein
VLRRLPAADELTAAHDAPIEVQGERTTLERYLTELEHGRRADDPNQEGIVAWDAAAFGSGLMQLPRTTCDCLHHPPKGPRTAEKAESLY